MKSLLECMRDYIMEFPGLREGGFSVDYLGSEATEYTVEAVPCEPVYRQYVDGDCMKQFLFLFASREFYSADIRQNEENAAFYEAFERWVTDNDKSGIGPDLDGRAGVSLEVLTKGYVFDADAGTARYQIQLRLIYEEE